MLTAALPSYMLPSEWKAFEKLPQNANGKIDRPRLREEFLRERSQPPGKPADRVGAREGDPR